MPHNFCYLQHPQFFIFIVLFSFVCFMCLRSTPLYTFSIANLCIIYKLLLPFHHIPDIRESYGIARSQTGFFVNAQAASVQKGAISGI